MNKSKYYVFLSCNEDINIDVPSFSMAEDEELEEEMNKEGVIPERLEQESRTTDCSLSENSTITKEGNNEWMIDDKEKNKIYSVKKEEGKLKIYENVCIEEYLNRKLSKNTAIECIKKHKDIKSARKKLYNLKKSSIYVINTHKDLDNIAYWELGYAMGKQITIIDFYDGNNEKRIPSIVDEVIGESRDVKHFFERIDQVILNLEPKVSVFSGDWNDLGKVSKKEPEATVSVFSGDWNNLGKVSKKEPEAT
jgi:hypothetical protein